MEINYKELLIKYIDLVMACEGINYINEAEIEFFTEEEIEELKKLSKIDL